MTNSTVDATLPNLVAIEQDPCAHLEALWHHHFPLSAAMDLRVTAYTDQTLTTQAPLQLNHNIHATAFAGSLYAMQSMTAWGLLYLACHLAGYPVSIIHAHGDIEFRQTVREDILATSTLTPDTTLFDDLANTGKSRLKLASQVHTPDGLASEFVGDYAIRVVR